MPELQRTLNLRDLLLLVVGAVIGSGIFVVPGAVLRQVDSSVAPALLIWFAGGFLSLLGALTYGELSAGHPHAGGLYIFIRDSFGKLPAFLYGWTLFFVIGNGAVATLSVAFSTYLGEIVPLSPIEAKTVSFLMITVVTTVNILGTRHSANLQNVTTAIKVSAILIMGIALIWVGDGFQAARINFWPSQIDWKLASNFGIGMIGVLWAYEGWQFVTFSAGETINPRRNYPIAFFVGLLTLISLYMFANLAYIAALGPAEAAATDRIASSAVTSVFGGWAGKLVAVAIMISIVSAANSIPLTASRVYFAMAKDGIFFKRMAGIHPRFRTPAFAVLAGSIWTALLAMTGTFEQLLTYVVFGGWIFYVLGAASIFVYRRRAPNVEGAYRTPAYPVTPLLFILAGTALVLNTIWTQPREALFGLAILFSGVPVYLFWHSRKQKAPEN